MKILFIGCVQSSYAFLKALLEAGAEVVGVITKKSSTFNADFADLTPLCEEYDVPVCYGKIGDEETVQFIREKAPDIGYCLGWSQLIPEEIIELFPKGMVGYHPAKLPNNRGRHPIIWALVLGLEETASSFFAIEKEADTGDILSQRIVPIDYQDTAQTLMDRLLECGAKQIVELTKELEQGTEKRVPQSKTSGNSWRKRGRADGEIDWRMSSRSIYNLVRALTKPYVGAHMMVGDLEIKIWRVREVTFLGMDYENAEPGKVIRVDEERMTVKTGDGLIEILECDPVKLQVGDYL